MGPGFFARRDRESRSMSSSPLNETGARGTTRPRAARRHTHHDLQTRLARRGLRSRDRPRVELPGVSGAPLGIFRVCSLVETDGIVGALDVRGRARRPGRHRARHEDRARGQTVGIYFSAHWCPPAASSALVRAATSVSPARWGRISGLCSCPAIAARRVRSAAARCLVGSAFLRSRCKSEAVRDVQGERHSRARRVGRDGRDGHDGWRARLDVEDFLERTSSPRSSAPCVGIAEKTAVVE